MNATTTLDDLEAALEAQDAELAALARMAEELPVDARISAEILLAIEEATEPPHLAVLAAPLLTFYLRG